MAMHTARGERAADRKASARSDQEDFRRRQLIEATIDAMAELGYVATTLSEIGRRAKVSPGLVAHYFGDKDGLLEATLRHLAARLGRSVIERLGEARTPRERIAAIIEANLAPEEFDHRTGTVWLAFWGQVIHSARLKRVQTVYQQRMLSNLRHALKQIVSPREAPQLAVAIAAAIDGCGCAPPSPPPPRPIPRAPAPSSRRSSTARSHGRSRRPPPRIRTRAR